MRVCAVTAAWILIGVAVAAQTPAPTAPAAGQPRSLTLTGCVKAWDTSTMGPPPAALGTASPVLVLTGAENAAAPTTPSPASDPARPPSGAAPAAGGHSTYLLKPASPTVNLAEPSRSPGGAGRHAGHRPRGRHAGCADHAAGLERHRRAGHGG